MFPLLFLNVTPSTAVPLIKAHIANVYTCLPNLVKEILSVYDIGG